MKNPYANRPEYTVWSRAVAGDGRLRQDMAVEPRFGISERDKLATAGSCFAQYVSQALPCLGLTFFDCESERRTDSEPIYSARYGNIYTARQLRQLFEFAYGLRVDDGGGWRDADGRYRDPLRPTIPLLAMPARSGVLDARELHMRAVRQVFEQCDTFVFTLGLTECWVGKRTGVVCPIHPGVLRMVAEEEEYMPHNLSVDEVVGDLAAFVENLKKINPRATVILTVSPVPLAATFEDRHVALSTTYSKAVLRVAVDRILVDFPHVDYYPSYEMVLCPSHGGSPFEADVRTVRPEVVSRVMEQFAETYRREGEQRVVPEKAIPEEIRARETLRMSEFSNILCDDDVLGSSADVTDELCHE